MLLEKQLSVRSLQTIFLLAFGLIYLYSGLESFYSRLVRCDGYALGDWLINYQDGGYKRRGLSGTTIIWISQLSGIYVGRVVFIFVSFFYLLYIGLLVQYLRKIRLNYFYILLFCLPTVFLFPINDFYAFGRKEFLFFTLLIFFLLMYRNGKVYSWKFVLFFSLLLFIQTHVHESVVFYTSYILSVYIYDFFYSKKGSILKIFTIAMSTFIPALCIFIFGTNVNSGKTWEILKDLGVGHNVMSGVFSYPIEGFGKGKLNALDFAKSKNYESHLLSYLITIIVFILFLYRNRNFYCQFYYYIYFHLCMLLISLPIFYLTIDWGRWLNIHFISFFLILGLKLPSNTKDTSSLKTIFNSLFSLKYILQITVLIFLMFSFSMKHVEIGFEFGPNNILNSLRDLFWKIRH